MPSCAQPMPSPSRNHRSTLANPSKSAFSFSMSFKTVYSADTTQQKLNQPPLFCHPTRGVTKLFVLCPFFGSYKSSFSFGGCCCRCLLPPRLCRRTSPNGSNPPPPPNSNGGTVPPPLPPLNLRTGVLHQTGALLLPRRRRRFRLFQSFLRTGRKSAVSLYRLTGALAISNFSSEPPLSGGVSSLSRR